MTAARAYVFPGKFSARTEEWPRVDLNYVTPLLGAYYDWAADLLPVGPITSWPALNTPTSIVSDGTGSPTVIESGGMRAVKLATGNRMRALTPLLPIKHTKVVVFRHVSPISGDTSIFGYGNSGGGTISVATDGTMAMVGYVNGKYLIPSPLKLADTQWHIGMLTVDGSNSSFRIDDQEAFNTGVVDNDAPGLSVGWNTTPGAAGAKVEIEYRRIIETPVLTASERAALYLKLRADYNI